MPTTATRSTAKTRKKAAEKKAASLIEKNTVSPSTAQIQEARFLADQRAQVEAVSRAAAARANVTPAIRELDKEIEASALVGQAEPRDMSTTGKAELDPFEIEIADGPAWRSKAEALAFLEEKVRVMVHDTSDRNEQKLVPVWVDGRAQFFMRNTPQIVRRKFVAALASAKGVSYSQEHYKDVNGNDAIRNNPHTALRYPFSIIEDRNPLGGAWLAKILAE